MRWIAGSLIAALGLASVVQAQPAPREIAFIANAEGATVSLVDVAARKVLGQININPEGAKSTRAGTQNFAQDTDVSPDGRTLYVSRGYLGDVAAFDVVSGRMLWKRSLATARSDHMTISHDGKFLFVSAWPSNVDRLDTRTGEITGRVVSGVYPHDTQVSRDGKRLYNSSLGDLTLPPAQREAAIPSATAGYAYQLTIADADTLQVRERIRLDNGLRPWRFGPGDKVIYAQFSNEQAVFAYDLAAKKVVKRLDLPVAPGVTPADYDFEAPHHGLSITEDGRTVCIAARASDYAALVKVPELTLIATIPLADAPGWAEIGEGDKTCLVVSTRADSLSFISIAERKEVARISVGDGPKHITVAKVPAAVVEAFTAAKR